MTFYIERVPGILEELSVHEWRRLFEGDRQVALDTLQGWTISTVWLGLNHQWTPGRPPLIYETMLIRPDGSFDSLQWRYTYRAQALAGHERAKERVRIRLKERV